MCKLVNGWVIIRPKGRLSRRSSLQPLTFMLEAHQPLVILLGVLMYLFLAPVKLSSLIDFERVITFSRTVLVFPLCQKCGLNILCGQSLIIMLMMPRKHVTLWLRLENESLGILAFYVRICTALTFVLTWMKLQGYWKILMFLSNSFQLVIISCLLTSHWLIKWLIQVHPWLIPLFLSRVNLK